MKYLVILSLVGMVGCQSGKQVVPPKKGEGMSFDETGNWFQGPIVSGLSPTEENHWRIYAPCPECSAGPGDPCVSVAHSIFKLTRPHTARLTKQQWIRGGWAVDWSEPELLKLIELVEIMENKSAASPENIAIEKAK